MDELADARLRKSKREWDGLSYEEQQAYIAASRTLGGVYRMVRRVGKPHEEAAAFAKRMLELHANASLHVSAHAETLLADLAEPK